MKRRTLLHLGNDIVDLLSPDIQQKYLDQRFLQRVFTAQEITTIQNHTNKNQVLWAIWAAKEAAYKACQKQFPALIFAHQKFFLNNSTLISLAQSKEFKELTGTLIYQNYTINIKLQNYSDAIHCLAVINDLQLPFKNWEKIHYSVLETYLQPNNTNPLNLKKYFSEQELMSIFSTESLLTRLHAKQFLQTLGFDPCIEIIRPVQFNHLDPPHLVIGNQVLTDCEISLSHDGQWVAVAVCYNQANL